MDPTLPYLIGGECTFGLFLGVIALRPLYAILFWADVTKARDRLCSTYLSWVMPSSSSFFPIPRFLHWGVYPARMM